ncbi:hypothetical protein Ciccas_012504 [Cichlidogyrus casuarinus]|uniref:PCTP-like protein n=1 Tax=Cichlidogyrus casuarinus TaxID=1844966 RepID=A0ABD2PNP4_9PLAT
MYGSFVQGKIPHVIINWGTKNLIPKVLQKLRNAAAGYVAWKAQHDPNYKPWLYPDQQKQSNVPLLQQEDILTSPDYAQETIDETKLDLGTEYEDTANSAQNGDD